MKKPIQVLCVLFLAAGLFVVQPRNEPAEAREPSRPNVLIIVTDDQREGLSVMPGVRRRFGWRGRRYPNAFVTTPQCCPSRSSILTGRYAHNHDVVNNSSGQRLDPRTTLQYYLQRNGYRTGVFGKFLNGWGGNTSPPYFNRWVTFAGEGWYHDIRYNVNGDLKRLPGYSTTILGNRAERFLRQSNANDDSRPWMIYLTPAAPHSPAQPEEKYRRARVPAWDGNPAVFEEDRTDKPDYVQAASSPMQTDFRKSQYRTLMSVDDAVSHLFRTMDELNERNTIAFFISDNGMLWGEHGWFRKSVPYTQAVEVPLLARWPGQIEGGSTDPRMVANIDITPTVLDAAGISPEGASFDGRSLLDPWERDRLLLEFFGPEETYTVPPWASLRTDEYQYIEYYDEGNNVIFKEYYDLVQDPWQLENLLRDADPSNDPPTKGLQQQLKLDRECDAGACP